MTVFAIVWFFIGTMPGSQASQALSPNIDINSILARAEAAYYDARFTDAIALLTPLDTALEGKPDRTQNRIQVKLQLALAYLGLNETAEAKARFAEIYDADPQFVMDPTKFSPKVLMLFNEARADQAVDNLFKTAVDEYKRGDLRQSLSKLQTILKLNPNHPLAPQYVKLIHERSEVSVGIIVLQWRSQFDARDFSRASETYRQLVGMDFDERADLALERVRGEYRKSLSEMFQSWNHACSAKDRASATRIRTEAKDLLPEPSIGEDILKQMTDCLAPPSRPVQTAVASVPEPAPNLECIQNPTTIALTRLKKRIEPQFPEEVGSKRVRVRATVRIDDTGNTTVQGLTGGTPAINRAVVKAVQNWKFYPAKVDNQARCVETEVAFDFSR